MPLSQTESFLTAADIIVVNQQFILDEMLDGLFYGIEFLLTISTCWVLYQKGLKDSPMRSFLVAATAIMFLGSTLNIFSDLIFDTLQIQGVVNLAYNPLPTMIRWEITIIIFARISYFLGDLIVVWRAWLLFQRELVPRCILVFCIVQSFGCCICDAVLTVEAIPQDIFVNFSIARIILPASLLFTNITATTLIMWKIVQYRHSIKIHLGNIQRKSQVEDVLILLIESGAIYCILWILIIPDMVSQTYDENFGQYLDVILPHMETIYPTAIILLAQLNKTHCDSTLQGLSHSHPLEFASPPSSHDQLSQSKHSQHGSNNDGNNRGDIELADLGVGSSSGSGDIADGGVEMV